MRRLALALALAAGCTRKPAAPPPPAPNPQRCAPGAVREQDPPVCLVLPDGFSEIEREKQPAFDLTRLVFESDTVDGARVTLAVTWFANGRRSTERARDDQAALARIAPGPGEKVLARGPTDDGNGSFVEVEGRAGAGPMKRVRSVVRTDHYRVTCEAAVPPGAPAALLQACRSLSVGP